MESLWTVTSDIEGVNSMSETITTDTQAESEMSCVSKDVQESLSSVEMDEKADEATIVDITHSCDSLTCNEQFEITLCIELPSGTQKNIPVTVPPAHEWSNSILARLLAYTGEESLEFTRIINANVPITLSDGGVEIDESRLPTLKSQVQDQEETMIFSEYGMDVIISVMGIWLLIVGLIASLAYPSALIIVLASLVIWFAFHFYYTPKLNPTDEVYHTKNPIEKIPTE